VRDVGLELDASTLEPARRKYLAAMIRQAKKLLAAAGFPARAHRPARPLAGYAAPWRSATTSWPWNNLAQVGIIGGAQARGQLAVLDDDVPRKYDKMAMGPFRRRALRDRRAAVRDVLQRSPRNRSRVTDPGLDRMLTAAARAGSGPGREIVSNQRLLADKAYYVTAEFGPVPYPSVVLEGLRNQDGVSLGNG